MKKHHKTRKGHMKIYRRPYPNAADPGYFKDKMVDTILSLASTMGVITIFFFFVTM